MLYLKSSLTVLSIFVLVQQIYAHDKTYSSKYDNLDVDKILENDRVLISYVKCILGEGPCTSEGKELKKLLPDALETGCSKCTEKQKYQSDRVIKHLCKHNPEEFKRLKAKYDPEDKYEEFFKRAAEAKAAEETNV